MTMTIGAFSRIHRNARLSLSPIAFALFAGARDITGGHAPVNRINARNLYPRKNGEVKTNVSLLVAHIASPASFRRGIYRRFFMTY